MHKGLWLNIGSSGRVVVGFENLDRERIANVKQCDIRLGLPYSAESAEIVCMSHVLEHLHLFGEIPGVLKEIHRVLMPGGVFRVAVPDLAVLARAYYNPTSDEAKNLATTQRSLKEYVGVSYEEMPPALKFSVIAFGDNSGNAAYDGHRVAFDEESLRWVLTRAGFTSFAVVSATESAHPELLKLYQDVQAPEEIVVEVVKL